MFASLPIFFGLCESEFDIRLNLSSLLHRQFIPGSEERPVSRAKISLEYSSKHSSIASKPDFDPNRENHGVQIWPGTTTISLLIPNKISTRSFASIPIIGLPSEERFP